MAGRILTNNPNISKRVEKGDNAKKVAAMFFPSYVTVGQISVKVERDMDYDG